MFLPGHWVDPLGQLNLFLPFSVSSTSISWIVAVVIAVLILLIVAILAVCIVMRNQGKTYLGKFFVLQ